LSCFCAFFACAAGPVDAPRNTQSAQQVDEHIGGIDIAAARGKIPVIRDYVNREGNLVPSWTAASPFAAPGQTCPNAGPCNLLGKATRQALGKMEENLHNRVTFARPATCPALDNPVCDITQCRARDYACIRSCADQLHEKCDSEGACGCIGQYHVCPGCRYEAALIRAGDIGRQVCIYAYGGEGFSAQSARWVGPVVIADVGARADLNHLIYTVGFAIDLQHELAVELDIVAIGGPRWVSVHAYDPNIGCQGSPAEGLPYQPLPAALHIESAPSLQEGAFPEWAQTDPQRACREITTGTSKCLSSDMLLSCDFAQGNAAVTVCSQGCRAVHKEEDGVITEEHDGCGEWLTLCEERGRGLHCLSDTELLECGARVARKVQCANHCDQAAQMCAPL